MVEMNALTGPVFFFSFPSVRSVCPLPSLWVLVQSEEIFKQKQLCPECLRHNTYQKHCVILRRKQRLKCAILLVT